MVKYHTYIATAASLVPRGCTHRVFVVAHEKRTHSCAMKNELTPSLAPALLYIVLIIYSREGTKKQVEQQQTVLMHTHLAAVSGNTSLDD